LATFYQLGAWLKEGLEPGGIFGLLLILLLAKVGSSQFFLKFGGVLPKIFTKNFFPGKELRFHFKKGANPGLFLGFNFF